MIRLCGFSLSNYYNKIKFALLEHEIPFEEQHVPASQGDAMLAHSPLGKVPFVLTEYGSLCESQAILEYLSACYPEKAIFSRDPWQAGFKGHHQPVTTSL